MARSRLISEAVILSKKINAVSEGAENLYYRLYLVCDDFGCFFADPKIIKGKAYTLRKISIEKIKKRMRELADIKLIKLYEIDGEMYYMVLKFNTYQKFRRDIMRKHMVPTCSQQGLRNVSVTPRQKSVTSWNVSGFGDKERESVNTILSSSNKEQDKYLEDSFREFWKAYPRKVEKTTAFKAFKTLMRKETLRTIAKATNGYNDWLKSERVRRGIEIKNQMHFIKYPASFLRENKWKEHIDFVYKPPL